MIFDRFRQRRRREQVAHSLYFAQVTQAREPAFYTTFGVPDSLEGRFDMIVLHGYAVMRRLGGISGERAEEAKNLSQTMFDIMFADMDRNLREMGVGDMGVGKRVQRMAEAFYGRVVAYDRALTEEGDALEAALARNLYQTVQPQPRHTAIMASYLRVLLSHLDAQDEQSLLDGVIHFPTPEAHL